MQDAGVVYLVGAGPGDPGLLTCRGLACLQEAEVLVYDGLVAVEFLSRTPAGCEHIYAGKKRCLDDAPLTQEEINQLLIDRASSGKIVVRLKGGDPFVFGRGAEECQALQDAGVRFEVVPGVSAATAVAAYAGIPLTARGVSASVTLVTGHEAPDKEQSDIDWSAVAGSQTIVLFMAWKKIEHCVAELLAAGLSADTPAAGIRWGTTARQKTIISTLKELPGAAADQAMRPPVLVVVGKVVNLREDLGWYERRPLFGKRILVTRGHEAGQGIASAIRALGGEAAMVATTQILDATEAQANLLATTLAAVQAGEWLFLTSANGVQACWKALHERGLDSRALAGVKIAAVGAATRAALGEHGLRADLSTVRCEHASLGESLAHALLDIEDPKGLRVIYPRAEQGREEPVEALRAAGSQVEVLTAYRSEPIPATNPQLARALVALRSGEMHGAAFFAPSQLRALCQADPKTPEYLARLPVIGAIGKTTAAALEELGLSVHALADKPSSRALVDAIAEAFSRR